MSSQKGDRIVSELALALIVAAATAVGAGIGGAVTGAVTLKVERQRQEFLQAQAARQEERERQREEQRQAQDLKEAARLVDEELRDATELIRNAVYQGRFWAPPRRLSGDVYTRYRHVLAVNLEDEAWTHISLAVQELNRLNWEVGKRPAEPNGLGPPFQPLDREDTLSIGLAIVEARKVLALVASPPDKKSLLEEEASEIAAAIFPLPDEDESA